MRQPSNSTHNSSRAHNPGQRDDQGQRPSRRRRRRPRPAGKSSEGSTRPHTRSRNAGPRPQTPRPESSSAFKALGLHNEILCALDQSGYQSPTPIQSQAIPPVLRGRDLLGCAQTGTGKTAAFALPILDLLNRSEPGPRGNRLPRALVLAPTRELAAQIHASFEQYGRFLPLRSTVVFGGVSKRPQTTALRRGVDVLVATPGRLLDLMGEGVLELSNIEIMVLDEADRMLDMGFIHDVKRIVAATPDERQTLLFSATLPPTIEKLAAETLDDPVDVAVAPVSSTIETTEQLLYSVDRPRKLSLLYTLLQNQEMQRVLVFSRTKHGANKVAKKLSGAGVATEALHGNKSQAARERALDGFKRGQVRVIVATDLAARGLDVKGLSHVINLDLPNEPETYVHRIGRTGRAGAVGVALSFCAPEERGHLASIERLTRTPLDRLDLPSLLSLPVPKTPSTSASPQESTSSPSKANARTRNRNKSRRDPRGPASERPSRPSSTHASGKSRRRSDDGGSIAHDSDSPKSGRGRGRKTTRPKDGAGTSGASQSPNQAPWWGGARKSRGRGGRPRHAR